MFSTITPLPPSDLDLDMQERWKPSAEQVEQASEFHAAHPGQRAVYTVHLLVGKQYGWWETSVQVEPVPGVFHSRDAALGSLEALVAAKGAQTDQPVVGGYTAHFDSGHWAVWDDILAVANQEV